MSMGLMPSAPRMPFLTISPLMAVVANKSSTPIKGAVAKFSGKRRFITGIGILRGNMTMMSVEGMLDESWLQRKPIKRALRTY
jgi:hypothetical protein